jgi:hypothetical protein
MADEPLPDSRDIAGAGTWNYEVGKYGSGVKIDIYCQQLMGNGRPDPCILP